MGKQEAVHRIRLRSMKVVPTGTRRALLLNPKSEQAPPVETRSKGSVFFNHPALAFYDELDESRNSRKSSIQGARNNYASASVAHIRNILVVDPHDIFLKLFTKSLKVSEGLYLQFPIQPLTSLHLSLIHPSPQY